jgi:hypothetical protein
MLMIGGASLRLILIKIFKFPNKNALLPAIFRFVACCSSYTYKMRNGRGAGILPAGHVAASVLF